MGKQMNELASYFLPIATQLLGECAAVGVPCRVVDTGRTPQIQAMKIKQHESWTLVSKHEPQLPEQKSEAIDICPTFILGENKADWDPESHLWDIIGPIGKKLGLRWGGDWEKPRRDPSHFEYVHTVTDYSSGKGVVKAA